MAAPGTVVAADDNLLMLYPVRSGDLEVHLRRAAALLEFPDGGLRSPLGLVHRLPLNAGRSYLLEQKR